MREKGGDAEGKDKIHEEGKYRKEDNMKKFIFSLTTITLLLVLSTTANSQDYEFILNWGERGNGPGQFISPWGIAVDSYDNVYVVDVGNYRIQKFDSNGYFILEWGSHGSEPGQFSNPRAVAVDSANNVYVADYHHCIQKFDSNGSFIAKWDETSGIGCLLYPAGVATDSFDNVYVVDYGYNRIKKFNSNLVFISEWIHEEPHLPYGIAVDSNDDVYVIGYCSHIIQKYDSNGILLTEWGSQGCGDGQFSWPQDIVADSDNNIFVDDYSQLLFRCISIQKFDPFGEFITKFGVGSYCSSGGGTFGWAKGIAVDSAGNVYVSDYGCNRISKFAPSNQLPVAVCKDIEISSDESCQASIVPEDIDDGSYDPDEDEITLSIDPHGPFPLGTTSVTLTVTDEYGESDSCTAFVTVADNIPPVPDLAELLPVTGECFAEIETSPTATDNCAGTIEGTTSDPLVYSEQGNYLVTWTFDDGHGNAITQTQPVSVQDVTPPELAVTVSPNTLWPPNHKLVLITPIIVVSDNCDPAPDVVLTSIITNEGDEINTFDPVFDTWEGDGHTFDDIQIDESGNIYLRAERRGGGGGRVYQITFTATDDAGNTTTASATVIVPHNQ